LNVIGDELPAAILDEERNLALSVLKETAARLDILPGAGSPCASPADDPEAHP
jgi:hypothetical protein